MICTVTREAYRCECHDELVRARDVYRRSIADVREQLRTQIVLRTDDRRRLLAMVEEELDARTYQRVLNRIRKEER